jgi:hypothetical protein
VRVISVVVVFVVSERTCIFMVNVEFPSIAISLCSVAWQMGIYLIGSL